jgi:hypothetical protein
MRDIAVTKAVAEENERLRAEVAEGEAALLKALDERNVALQRLDAANALLESADPESATWRERCAAHLAAQLTAPNGGGTDV